MMLRYDSCSVLRQPAYRELETKVRSITNRPEVRDAVETTKEAAIHQVTDASAEFLTDGSMAMIVVSSASVRGELGLTVNRMASVT